MPIPLKPCDGQLSDDLQELLSKNRNREQWALHTCQLCGASVGAVLARGKWVPEQHWPSVTYPPRQVPQPRYHRAVQTDDALSISR